MGTMIFLSFLDVVLKITTQKVQNFLHQPSTFEIRRSRDRRSPVMEIILVFTHSGPVSLHFFYTIGKNKLISL